jgi:hypothetical protein
LVKVGDLDLGAEPDEVALQKSHSPAGQSPVQATEWTGGPRSSWSEAGDPNRDPADRLLVASRFESGEVGTKLNVHMGASGGRGMTFKPTVLAASPGQELRWLGKLGFSGIADGEHFFILTPNADGGTCLTHGERYSGVLVSVIRPFMKKGKSQNGYEDFNRVFKRRVESFGRGMTP